ncbi:hypothetical protein [Pontiella sulfatireligans]|uniref:Uncharacterized protein n=1 Tax=Pontiella sulfatireligans TaxID=2750658 RepID=A0A6C2UF73_9BACT|nr:hypothetical protein [Pontiella sulfatireligans]VGO18071.1 hypothetical protein SCARR_00122 [Pontiella sulfatireligans]
MKKLLLIIIISTIANIGYSDDMPPEVKRLKILRDKKTEEIDSAYNRELDKLKKNYAANGNYKAIAYIENMQIVAIDAKVPDAGEIDRKQRAKLYCRVPETRFKNEARAVPDSNNYVIFFNIPEAYSDWKMTLRSAEPLVFKVKEAGMVTLVTLETANRQLDRSGWKQVDSFYTGKESPVFRFLILEKYLEVGEYEIKGDGKWGAPRLLIEN